MLRKLEQSSVFVGVLPWGLVLASYLAAVLARWH
jgi:hypothetical protein